MKVRDIIWHRKFPHGGYNYTEGRIVGESSRSWFVRKDGQAFWIKDLKIPKSGKGYQFGTKKDAELAKWAGEHCWRIGHMVSAHMNNAPLMLKIAALVGYADIPESEKENYHGSTSIAEVNPR